jgi:hypothetical protein
MKTLQRACFAFLAVSLTTAIAAAADTPGYVRVTLTKAWSSSTEPFHIWLQDVPDGRQTCSNTSEFRLAKAQGDIYRMLTSAQLGNRTVQLQYTCSGTVANITGVRMK